MTTLHPDGLQASASRQPLLAVMEKSARAAGAIVRAGIGNHGDLRRKGPRDLVTDIDTASERAIARTLEAEFPGVGFLGEETGRTAGTTGFEWIVDPLDGTRNFVLGIPFFCVSIALVEAGNPVAGVIYDPVHDEMFSAVGGSGLRLNGRRIRVDRPGKLAETVVGYDLSRDEAKAAAMLEVLDRLEPLAQSVRGLGSTALGFAYVASGRLDMYLSWGGAWDVAAGLALAVEGGARVADRHGGQASVDSGSYVVAGGEALAEFMKTTEGLRFRSRDYSNAGKVRSKS